MTVTLISPPDGSVMASTSMPVVLTATASEVEIVTRYPSGSLYDVVYFNGTFAPAYAASTKVGTTYSIVRMGGWPSALTVSVYEPPASSGDVPDWQILYDVDLTAQGDQTIAVAGSYTIDGKTWWVKGAIQTGQTLGLVSGQGLKDFSDGSSSLLLASGTSVVTQALYFFPLAQLTNFNASAPIAVQAQLTDALETSPSVRPFFGIVSASLNSSAWDTRTSQMLFGWSNVGGVLPTTNIVAYWAGASGWTQAGATSSAVATSLDNYYLSLTRVGLLGVCGVDPYPSFVSPALSGSLAGTAGLAAAAMTSPCIVCGASAPITQSAQAYIRRIRIWQPRVV